MSLLAGVPRGGASISGSAIEFWLRPAPCRSPAHGEEMEDQEVTMRTPQQTGSDLMGRIEHLVAAGIPKLHLLRLSADLMLAGRVARRVGASVGQLTEWCRDCLNDHPGAAEQLISEGMPLTMMIRLSNDLASLGWCARACSVPDSFRELAIE